MAVLDPSRAARYDSRPEKGKPVAIGINVLLHDEPIRLTQITRKK
jgi:hypothetical protein